MKLYLDGCSYTYGQGLPRNQSLAALLQNRGGYEVTDFSRPGKSNLAIAMDAYENTEVHDVLILGWTYSSRFTLKYQDQNLDFYSGSHGNGYGITPQELDHAHTKIHKYFYTVFAHPYCDQLSDMLVDTTLSHLSTRTKKVIAFGWEKRNTKNHLHYPYIPPEKRLPDGHLNFAGMNVLYDYLQNLM